MAAISSPLNGSGLSGCLSVGQWEADCMKSYDLTEPPDSQNPSYLLAEAACRIARLYKKDRNDTGGRFTDCTYTPKGDGI